jgi:hypothetical protein
MVMEDVRNADGLSTAEQISYDLSVTGSGEKLKITLVWTEPPASPGASFASVNDLDLAVESPNGDLYLGNVFQSGVSATGGTKDDRNNVEQVHIAAPQTGEWTVRVIGAAVNEATQGYALVATGEVAAKRGDSDWDGDVDLDDFGRMVKCFEGPELAPRPQAPITVDQCLEAFDIDADGDVDLFDFGKLQGPLAI